MKYCTNNSSKDDLALLKELIKFPSINPPGNENQISDFVYEYMTGHGIETIRIPVTNSRNNIVSKIKGRNSDNGIIFTGHMDVVPVSLEEKKQMDIQSFYA